MQELLTFDDVLIVPKFSKVASRQDVNLSTGIRELKFKLPIISANMDTVTGTAMANAMIDSGAQACLHRFSSIEEALKDFANTYAPCAMVSIGLGNSELERAKALWGKGAHTFVIDVAHGAQMAVAEQVKSLREITGPYANVIVGNFASADSVKEFLEHVGTTVDAIKVGIGPGSACTTRIKTGVGYPQLSAVMEISKLLKNTDIKVIADGGMKTSGDIAKALGAGAHMVMLGGMLSGTDETPGDMFYMGSSGPVPPEVFLARKVYPDGTFSLIRDEYSESFPKVKKYRGSASKESYGIQGKDAAWRSAEGESFFVPYKGPVKDVLQDIEGGLRSAFAYVGAANLSEFHRKVEFVRISSSTVAENGAHGKS